MQPRLFDLFELWVLQQRKLTNPRARLTSGSGSKFDKGDILDSIYHIECKHSASNGITLLWSWWLKALNELKTPLLVIGYGADWELGRTAGIITDSCKTPEEIVPTTNYRIKDFRPRVFLWHDIPFEIMDSFPMVEITDAEREVLDWLPNKLGDIDLPRDTTSRLLDSLIAKGIVTNERGTFIEN